MCVRFHIQSVNVWLHVREHAVHICCRMDILDTNVHTSSSMSSYRCLDGDMVRTMSRSRNRQNHQNLEFSRKVEILAIWAISGSGRDSGHFRQNLDFGQIQVRPARIQVLAVGPGSGRSARIWPDSQNPAPSSDLRIWPDPGSNLPESRFQALYIDHFQLPPWWKMTGEDGDPFRGRRWHWPSKRSNFEKNLLITKSLKIAEKGTFFSFTPRKCRKSAIFLPPRSDFCRHLRRSDDTAASTNFRFFEGAKKSKILALFSDSGKSRNLVSELDSGHPDGPAKVATLASGQRFQPGPYETLQMAKISTFRENSRFCGFSGFLHFFEILQIFVIFADFWHFRKCPKKSIFWTPKPDFFGVQNRIIFGHSGHENLDVSTCVTRPRWPL